MVLYEDWFKGTQRNSQKPLVNSCGWQQTGPKVVRGRNADSVKNATSYKTFPMNDPPVVLLDVGDIGLLWQ